MVNTDGSGQVAVIETPADEQWAVISPDGTMLAYQSDAAGQHRHLGSRTSAASAAPRYDATDPGTNLTADSPFPQ
jgi:hypothetical protein